MSNGALAFVFLVAFFVFFILAGLAFAFGWPYPSVAVLAGAAVGWFIVALIFNGMAAGPEVCVT